MRAGRVIFDLDGTLIDSAPLIAGIINEMLQSRGAARRVTPLDAHPVLTQGGDRLVATLMGAEAAGLDQDVSEFRRRYRERPTPPDCLYDGVREGLARLRSAGWRMAVCSNKPQPLCEKVLNDLGIGQLFDGIAGSVPGVPLKPAPPIGLAALNALGHGSERVHYIGDSEVDRRTAATLNLPFVHVTYGYAEADMLPGDYPSFATFQEAIDLILLGERSA